MSFINIHTNNLSRQLRNATTYLDNWIYVPGTAITGDWKKPYAFRSLDEFQAACGTKSPEGSITYEYVAGLLSAGLPVLFRRIAYQNQNNLTEEDITSGRAVGVTRAELVLNHTDATTGIVSDDVSITEKYGGSFGNDLNITIKISNGTTYYLEVYAKNTLVEKAKLLTLTPDDVNQTEINQKLIDALNALDMERISVTVLEEDASKFALEPVTNKYLTGGADIDEGLVPAEIPASLDYIKDKILFQPKFLTSGGYVDSDVATATPIADKMKELTKLRQDCRALLDLPIGTPAEQQQSLAENYAYQQLGNNVEIPSASICAPWVYMQVGTEQLWMPPSYAFLTLVGNAVSGGGHAYTPKAGLSTGRLSNIIKPEFEIGSTLSEQWQSDTDVNINPIMRLQSGSYIVAGNSTLLMPDIDGMEINAFQESSADLTVIEIRRFVFNLATELQYQYNGVAAFENFSLRTAKFFNVMVSEGAMSDYEITNLSSNNDPRTLKVQIDVYLTPTIKKIEIFLNVAYGNIELSTGGAE